MKRAALLSVVVFLATVGTPAVLVSQDGAVGDPFRPYLFVLLAFAGGWVVVAAWVYRIASKVKRMSDRIDGSDADV